MQMDKYDDGVPAGQTIMSATGSGFSFVIQPAGVNNVLRIDRTESRSLILGLTNIRS